MRATKMRVVRALPTLPSGSANLASHLRPSITCSALTALTASAAGWVAGGGGCDGQRGTRGRCAQGNLACSARAVSHAPGCAAGAARRLTGVAKGDEAEAARLARVLLAHDLRLVHRPVLAEVLLQREVVRLPGNPAGGRQPGERRWACAEHARGCCSTGRQRRALRRGGSGGAAAGNEASGRAGLSKDVARHIAQPQAGGVMERIATLAQHAWG